MTTVNNTAITIETIVNAPATKVWECWTKPEHFTQWNNASDDWHTPHATNDLRVGGKFTSRMEAKDGSFGFDFEGIYDEVKDLEVIAYHLTDARTVRVTFTAMSNQTKVTETFDAETETPIEMQRGGWQAILDNFKKYVETNA